MGISARTDQASGSEGTSADQPESDLAEPLEGCNRDCGSQKALGTARTVTRYLDLKNAKKAGQSSRMRSQTGTYPCA
jgi:hypothetical protein